MYLPSSYMAMARAMAARLLLRRASLLDARSISIGPWNARFSQGLGFWGAEGLVWGNVGGRASGSFVALVAAGAAFERWGAGESKRSMYTDVAAARVGRRPDGVSESHVDALDGIEEMAAGAGSTAKMSIVLKSFEKIHPGRLASVSKVGLPTTRILFTFNRSPHVDKKARDQFEMKTQKHLLVMAMDVGKLREKYNQLKNHNMLGVQLKVNFHYKTRLDMSRIQGHVPEATLVGQGSVAA